MGFVLLVLIATRHFIASSTAAPFYLTEYKQYKSRQLGEALGELPFRIGTKKMDLHEFALGKYVANM